MERGPKADDRQETGDRRQETGDRRQETAGDNRSSLTPRLWDLSKIDQFGLDFAED